MLGNGTELIQTDELISAETESVHTNSENESLEDMLRDLLKRNVKNGQLYTIWGIEDQDGIDYTIPLRIMGYDYDAYKAQVDELLEERGWILRETEETGESDSKDKEAAFRKKHVRFRKEDRLAPVITLVLYYSKN